MPVKHSLYHVSLYLHQILICLLSQSSISFNFPVRLGFCMSINKAQGQSVTVVGLNLQIPVFTHGQLYVALSRCTTKQGVKILFPDGMPNL